MKALVKIRLTTLEKFVYFHRRRFCDIAAETNRSEIEIEKAFLRAKRKISDAAKTFNVFEHEVAVL